MFDAACCVVDDSEVWIAGGETPDDQRSTDVYSSRDGRRWQPQPKLPTRLRGHTMRWDGDAIWAISGIGSSEVYVLRRGGGAWEAVRGLRGWRGYSDSVCWGRYIVMPGGRTEEELGGTASILVMDTRTGHSHPANISLPQPVWLHCVALIT